jgi:hypothetical protein
MENDNNKPEQKKDNPYTPVNPFTNQAMPANPPTPAFNPPGEIKPPPPVTPAQTEPIKTPPKYDFKIIFLYILLIGIGGVLAKYAFDFFVPKPQKPVTPQLINVNAKPASQPLIKIVPGKQQPAASSSSSAAKKQDQPLASLKKKLNQTVNPFVLSGIFFSGEQNYCIINDKVLGEGDSVEGAKVIRISSEEVELQLNEKTLRLNLRGK